MFERLTEWNRDHTHGQLLKGDGITRLCKYEDSKLTPEEVQEIATAKSEGRLLIRPFTWEELNKQKSFAAKLGGKQDV